MPTHAPPVFATDLSSKVPVRFALAALSGVLVYLAAPGVGLWPLAFVQWTPLYLALSSALAADAPGPPGLDAWRAARLGWVCGFVSFALGTHWLPRPLAAFMATPPALIFPCWIGLCAYQAGQSALLAVLFRWCGARARVARHTAFALAVVSVELLFPSFIPYFSAASLHEVPLLLQMLDVTGPSGPSFVLALSSVAVSQLIAPQLRRGTSTRFDASARAFALALALSCIYGAARPAWMARSATELKVAIVQPNPQTGLEKRKFPSAALQESLSLTREALRAAPADLVIWSETILAQPLASDRIESRLRRRLSGLPPVSLLLGSVLKTDSGEHTNSALVLDADGRLCSGCRYDKQLLLPFAERAVLGVSGSALGESAGVGTFVRGSHSVPLPVPKTRAAVFVCYESLFAGYVRRLVTPDTGLLINLSNDAWFDGTPEPYYHVALARLRAIEHRKFMLRATTSGISAIIEPSGAIVASTAPAERAVLTATVAVSMESSVYAQLGDAPWWLLMGWLALRSIRHRGRHELSAAREKARIGRRA